MAVSPQLENRGLGPSQCVLSRYAAVGPSPRLSIRGLDRGQPEVVIRMLGSFLYFIYLCTVNKHTVWRRLAGAQSRLWPVPSRTSGT
jgi:hypothetical protein